MEKTHSSIIIGILILIVGLILGYFLSAGTMNRRYPYRMMGYGGGMMYGQGYGMMGSGEEYEEAFLRGMIMHHLGAISMAEELLEETERPELVDLANGIIETQAKEVEMMEGWLKDWY